ncbi:hypothetical protein D039_3052A, partial [Vibrio parahaemolyticus EKP-028]
MSGFAKPPKRTYPV